MFSQNNLFALAILLVITNQFVIFVRARSVGHGALPGMYPNGQFDAIATRLLLCCGALQNPEYDSDGFYKRCQGLVYQAYETDDAREFHQQLDQLKDTWDLPDSCFNIPAVYQVQPHPVSLHQQEPAAQKKSGKKGRL